MKKSSLKTLSRSEPEFQQYLLGTFSKAERAIPLQTLNANSDAEQVTFQIVPVSQIHQPPFFKKWVDVFKFRSFLLVGFPIFAILTKNLIDDVPMDPTVVICTVLACFAALVGANLLNDYFDHMRGLDRIHPEQMRKPIQKGWVTAFATRWWASFFLAAGLLLGLPALFLEPDLLWVVTIPAAVALGAWLTRQKGLKFRRGSEFLVFILAGPLLSVGFQLAVSGEYDIEALFIGVLTGWFSVFLMHLKNFESLLVNAQAGLESSVVRLGFDKAKKLLLSWWVCFLILFAVFHYVYALPEWFYVSLICPAIFSIAFFRQLKALSSPVGSAMSQLVKVGRTGAILVLSLWLVENLWLLLVVEFGAATLS